MISGIQKKRYPVLWSFVILLVASCSSAPKYRTIPISEPEPLPPSRTRIVQIARSYIGTPYRRGGESRKGVDCSGLALAVYNSAGIRLPRTSAAQSRFGVRVAREHLEPGDLLFFATSRVHRISHVGIYIGNGKFVHASTHARRVRIDSLSLPYFKLRFVLARRVFHR